MTTLVTAIDTPIEGSSTLGLRLMNAIMANQASCLARTLQTLQQLLILEKCLGGSSMQVMQTLAFVCSLSSLEAP